MKHLTNFLFSPTLLVNRSSREVFLHSKRKPSRLTRMYSPMSIELSTPTLITANSRWLILWISKSTIYTTSSRKCSSLVTKSIFSTNTITRSTFWLLLRSWDRESTWMEIWRRVKHTSSWTRSKRSTCLCSWPNLSTLSWTTISTSLSGKNSTRDKKCSKEKQFVTYASHSQKRSLLAWDKSRVSTSRLTAL